MYRIDTYSKNPNKQGNKKVSSHWYASLEEAENARIAISNLNGWRTFQQGENRKLLTLYFDKRVVTKPVEDNKY